jgi:hypothetical protein
MPGLRARVRSCAPRRGLSLVRHRPCVLCADAGAKVDKRKKGQPQAQPQRGTAAATSAKAPSDMGPSDGERGRSSDSTALKPPVDLLVGRTSPTIKARAESLAAGSAAEASAGERAPSGPTRDQYLSPAAGEKSPISGRVSPAIGAKVDELFKLEPAHEREVIQTDVSVAHIRPIFEKETGTTMHVAEEALRGELALAL